MYDKSFLSMAYFGLNNKMPLNTKYRKYNFLQKLRILYLQSIHFKILKTEKYKDIWHIQTYKFLILQNNIFRKRSTPLQSEMQYSIKPFQNFVQCIEQL